MTGAWATSTSQLVLSLPFGSPPSVTISNSNVLNALAPAPVVQVGMAGGGVLPPLPPGFVCTVSLGASTAAALTGNLSLSLSGKGTRCDVFV